MIKIINTGDGGGNGNGTGLRIHPVTGQLWVANSNLPSGSSNGIRIVNTDGSVGGTINISAHQKKPHPLRSIVKAMRMLAAFGMIAVMKL